MSVTRPGVVVCDLTVLLLDVLGHRAEEFTSLFYEVGDDRVHTAVRAPAGAIAAISAIPENANVFFGVNPVRGPVRTNDGRGKAEDVTRLAALCCDLDMKDGGCASLDVAYAIVADLSLRLGTRPTAVVESGHGLHAYWPIDDGAIGREEFTTGAARALLRRWGRLVAVEAERLHAAADTVCDLPRMLRVPGTFNNKMRGNGAQPLPVVAYTDTGAPLTVAEVDERLSEYGIYEEDDDTAEAVVLSPPEHWRFGADTHGYVAAILDAIPGDGPKPGDGRHPWVLRQAVRLACAYRLGCISQTDWRRAPKLLGKRLAELRAATGEAVPKYEVPGAFSWAIGKAASKTDGAARADLGIEDTAGDDDHAEGAAEQRDLYEIAVGAKTNELRVLAEARRRVDEENRPPIIIPPARGLTALLAEDDTPTRYRIDAVAPVDARILLSAQFKAGKSTVIANLIRSLVDGDPFLGRFTVNTPACHAVLVDDELSENMLRRWLREQGIVNTDNVADVISLRGRVGAFNLLDDRRRSEWVQRLADQGCDYLILDCLRPVLDALGLDESHDAGRFLVAFDALLTEAGIADACVLQHMGHGGERARGDSRLLDWPDAIWRVVRETEEPDSPRYFSAYGRDVEVPEGRLNFDPATRRLTYTGGSRADVKADAAVFDVVELLAESSAPLSKSSIEMQLAGGAHSQGTIRAAIKAAITREFVTVTSGPRGAKLCSIAYPCSRCGMPVASRRERHQSCPTGPEGLRE